MSSKNETEVFRMTPIPGKCYATAKYTSKMGTWPEEKYYTIEQLVYLGKFTGKTKTIGYGDGSKYYEYFENNGTEKEKEKELEYDYEGKTCLVEVPCNSYGGGICKQKRTQKSIKKNKHKSKKETINYLGNKRTKTQQLQ